MQLSSNPCRNRSVLPLLPSRKDCRQWKCCRLRCDRLWKRQADLLRLRPHSYLLRSHPSVQTEHPALRLHPHSYPLCSHPSNQTGNPNSLIPPQGFWYPRSGFRLNSPSALLLLPDSDHPLLGCQTDSGHPLSGCCWDCPVLLTDFRSGPILPRDFGYSRFPLSGSYPNCPALPADSGYFLFPLPDSGYFLFPLPDSGYNSHPRSGCRMDSGSLRPLLSGCCPDSAVLPPGSVPMLWNCLSPSFSHLEAYDTLILPLPQAILKITERWTVTLPRLL